MTTPKTHTKTFKFGDDQKMKLVWWMGETSDSVIKEEWNAFRRRNVGWSKLDRPLERLAPSVYKVNCWFTGDKEPTLAQIRQAAKIFFG